MRRFLFEDGKVPVREDAGDPNFDNLLLERVEGLGFREGTSSRLPESREQCDTVVDNTFSPAEILRWSYV